VTILDALSHHSGLPRHDMTWAFNTSSPREPVRKLCHLLLSEPIRTKWIYNNMMYITMGHLISFLTGQNSEISFALTYGNWLGMHETLITFSAARAAYSKINISNGYYISRTGHTADVGDTTYSLPAEQATSSP
jgi:hypothetical protein